MAPAVTSEACVREKRIKTTVSAAYNNLNATAADARTILGMNTDNNPAAVVGSPPDVIHDVADGSAAAGCMFSVVPSVDDTNRSSGLFPGGSVLNLQNVNFVNLKDIQNKRTVNIFIKNNNTCAVMPAISTPIPMETSNGTMTVASLTAHGVVSNSTCNGSSICRMPSAGQSTIAVQSQHLRLVKATDPSLPQSVASSAASDATVHMIIIPRTVSATLPSTVPDNELLSTSVASLSSISSAQISIVSGISQTQELKRTESVANTTDSIIARQLALGARALRTMKRLRRLQCREANSFVKEQFRRLIPSLNENVFGSPSGPTVTGEPDIVTDGSSATFRNKDIKSMSTSELVSLVQKFQSSQVDVQCPDATVSAPTTSKCFMLEQDTCVEMDRTAGFLISNLRHLEKGVDSDATESSSGGESGDEFVESASGDEESNQLNTYV